MRRTIFLLLLAITCQAFGQNVQFRSLTTYPSDMSDVWGYADGGNEYALATYEDGFSVVDVTDPDNPEILHDIPGPNTLWRDIKTYGHYAYGITEDVGFANHGLIIMDLSKLPEELPVTYWNTDGNPNVNFQAAHNIFIDEKGVAYLIGHNTGGGVIMIDVAANPTNPTYLGSYEDHYVHDCFARNDTLWTAEVGAGQFSVIDISNKSNPVVLAEQETPLAFTHNIWLSDDGKTAFTTDERTGAYLAAYDVTDLNDIREIDRYRSAGNVIPHNAIVHNEFVLVSWYSHGLIILDATFPDELVEVGRFDTSPNFPGPGFHGAWGVYPYLPSGNILITDIEEGLVVLSPDYKNATHIRGSVINAVSREIISGASVSIDGPGGMQSQTTDLEGAFKRGQINGGTFSITVTKVGFEDKTLEIILSEGETAELEIELDPVVYIPADTIIVELNAGESGEFCSEFSIAFDADLAFVCGGSSSSALGAYSVSLNDGNGCLSYTASSGGIDEVCFVVLDESTGDFHATLVIVNIAGNVTGIESNGFENGDFTLVGNPVGSELVMQRHSTDDNKLNINILDTQGRLIFTTDNAPFNDLITIPAGQFNRGLYILSVYGENDHLGSVKFVKE